MNTEQLHEMFLDLLEDSLPEELKEEVLDYLEQNPKSHELYRQYRTIARLERTAAAELPQLTEDLSDSVMNAIDRMPVSQMETIEIPQAWINQTRWLIGSLSSVVVLLIIALVSVIVQNPYGAAQRVAALTGGTFQPRPASLSMMHGRSQPSQLKYVSSRSALTEDAHHLVAVDLGPAPDLNILTHPNSHVDIHTVYEAEGVRRQRLIASLVKVHSVVIRQSPDGSGTNAIANLLVPGRDIAVFQAARVLGEKLRLTVMAPDSIPTPQPQSQTPLKDPKGRIVDQTAPGVLAVLYEPDPESGKQVRKVFTQGQWKASDNVVLAAF